MGFARSPIGVRVGSVVVRKIVRTKKEGIPKHEVPQDGNRMTL